MMRLRRGAQLGDSKVVVGAQLSADNAVIFGIFVVVMDVVAVSAMVDEWLT